MPKGAPVSEAGGILLLFGRPEFEERDPMLTSHITLSEAELEQRRLSMETTYVGKEEFCFSALVLGDMHRSMSAGMRAEHWQRAMYHEHEAWQRWVAWFDKEGIDVRLTIPQNPKAGVSTEECLVLDPQDMPPPEALAEAVRRAARIETVSRENSRALLSFCYDDLKMDIVSARISGRSHPLMNGYMGPQSAFEPPTAS